MFYFTHLLLDSPTLTLLETTKAAVQQREAATRITMKKQAKAENRNYTDDDDSTVSYDSGNDELRAVSKDAIITGTNYVMKQPTAMSTGKHTNEDDDDSTACTAASTNDDDMSFALNDLLSMDGDCTNNRSILRRNNSNSTYSSHERIKCVTFGDSTVREYGVTVGACTPEMVGRCPIELMWEYSESYNMDLCTDDAIEKRSSKLTRSGRIHRPLSIQARRERIANVQGISTKDVVAMEYESSLSLIQDTIQSITTCSNVVLSSMETNAKAKKYNNRLQQIINEIQIMTH